MKILFICVIVCLSTGCAKEKTMCTCSKWSVFGDVIETSYKSDTVIFAH